MYNTWKDVENVMDELVQALITRFEKNEAQINFMTKQIGSLKEELAKAKAEPKVVNNYNTYPQPVWPQQVFWSCTTDTKV